MGGGRRRGPRSCGTLMEKLSPIESEEETEIIHGFSINSLTLMSRWYLLEAMCIYGIRGEVMDSFKYE